MRFSTQTFLTATLLLIFSSSICVGDTLKLCVSDSNWHPYVIIEGNEVSGIYIDMLTSAVELLSHEIEFEILPWKRCLHQTKEGKYDGIAGVSYQEKRAVYLDYPNDTNHSTHSEFRLSQVEYVVVTMQEDAHKFSGDVKTLPVPIRSPLGFSIGIELEKQGLLVDNAALNDSANIRKLRRDKTGSVVLIKEMALLLINNNSDLTIHKQPLKSKAYFLAFSKKTKLTQHQKAQLWNAGKNIRKNKVFMHKTFAKYHQ